MRPGSDDSFTGRAAELGALATARAPGGRGAVLVGAAGIGKTRLAAQAARHAAAHGAAIRRVRATDSSRALPLGAFAPLLTEAIGMAPDFSILIKAAELVLPPDRPDAVLVVDDAHLLDPLSAALLLHLVQTHDTARVLVTVRGDEPCPDAVTALWKDRHIPRHDIGPLSEADTNALLEHLLGAPLQSHTRTRLWHLTRGNPLFIHTAVDAALTSGALARVAGLWRWRGGLAVTPGLSELISERLDTLDAAVYTAVETVAYGEPIGLHLLHRLAEPAAVETAERFRLIEVVQDGRRLEARLAHPLYGEAIRARTPKTTERRIHTRLAQALAATGGRRTGDTLRRARHTLDSDQPADPGLLTQAAARAIGLYQLDLAARCARGAIDAGGPVEAGIMLGIALSWLNRGAEAEATMAADAHRAATEHQITTMAFIRAANLNWVLGQPDRADRVLAEGRDELRTPQSRAVLDAFRAAFIAHRGDSGQALLIAEAVLATPDCPPVARVFAHFGATEALAVTGHGDQVPDRITAAHAAADLLPAELGIMRHGLGMGHLNALLLAGRLDAADQAVEFYAGYTDRTLARTGIMLMYGYHATSYFRGATAAERGLLTTAADLIHDALAGFSEEDPGNFATLACLSLAQVHGAMGDAAATAATVAELGRHYRPGTQGMFEPVVRMCRAWLAAAEGTVGKARSAARDAAECAARLGQFAVEAVALHTAVRFGDRTCAARLAVLTGQVDGPRVHLAARHARAWADRDAVGLLAVSAALADMGASLVAADAAAQAAVVYRERGDLRAEQSASARARRLLPAGEGADTPALREALRPSPLTEREREIAALVAAGYTNRQIAEHLVVSVRTVEGHVYRACVKLGVADRAALAELVIGPGQDR